MIDISCFHVILFNMEKIQVKSLHSPFGELVLGSYKGKICLCDWKFRKQRDQIDNRIMRYLSSTMVASESEILQELTEQLKEYFIKHRGIFDIPILMAGSDFQRAVWDALTKISYGDSCSYLELATQLGNPSTVRAVASAVGANGLSLLVPCHRVIGSNGELRGYAGGLNAKRKLLDLEG